MLASARHWHHDYFQDRNKGKEAVLMTFENILFPRCHLAKFYLFINNQNFVTGPLLAAKENTTEYYLV